jgi:hypothetical protein
MLTPKQLKEIDGKRVVVITTDEDDFELCAAKAMTGIVAYLNPTEGWCVDFGSSGYWSAKKMHYKAVSDVREVPYNLSTSQERIVKGNGFYLAQKVRDI